MKTTHTYAELPDAPFSILLRYHPSQSARRDKVILEELGYTHKLAADATRQDMRIAYEVRRRGIGQAVCSVYPGERRYKSASPDTDITTKQIAALTVNDVQKFGEFVEELQGDEPTTYTKYRPVLSRATADFLLFHSSQD